ncbi:MAG: gamma-glutamyl-gamma-aminobutyrate hydrolase family protein [Rhodospirillales bacterium]
MPKKPLIGVTGSRRKGRIMTFLNRLAVWRAGGRSVRITWDKPYPIDRLDGLVIGGGDDISATLYGGEVSVDVRVDPRRDEIEMEALKIADERDIPVLGICRGSQIMNVYYGGSLHTEIRDIYKDAPQIRTVLPRKCVEIIPDTRLATLLRVDHCYVNSLHHQAVDTLGDGFGVAAKDEHGMIQGVERTDRRFLLGVQWHPEFLFWQPRQQRLFDDLVAAAKERMAV